MSSERADNDFSADSWRSLVQGDGYLDPAQCQAFRQAIGMVSDSLHTTLGKPPERLHGRFDLAAHVDSLETDFQRNAGTDQVNAAAAVTAFWIVRIIADRLLEAAGDKTR
ncbi:HrpW-specific chaperone [Pseudomonas sp. NPDC086278]|uniref:HrpW-specific chaperone n=1 Tax=Pseudomonas sp. NPDC086278 TaxID=3390646 RepID=UPI003D06BB9E